MREKNTKRVFESEALLMPAIKMVLIESNQRQSESQKDTGSKKKNRPNQRTVLRIIEALNKAD
jgi:hypothetical protein